MISTDNINKSLDEAEKEAMDSSTKYYTHEEIFPKIKRIIEDSKNN